MRFYLNSNWVSRYFFINAVIEIAILFNSLYMFMCIILGIALLKWTWKENKVWYHLTNAYN